jgi:hypothetical protein
MTECHNIVSFRLPGRTNGNSIKILCNPHNESEIWEASALIVVAPGRLELGSVVRPN